MYEEIWMHKTNQLDINTCPYDEEIEATFEPFA